MKPGKPIKDRTYTITDVGSYAKGKGMKIALPKETGFKPGDKVYLIKTNDGILLMPKDKYENS